MEQKRSIVCHVRGTVRATWLGTDVRRMPPTKGHRPAVWESLLGTVNAMNKDRVVKYFDYDWEAALAYAGVTPEADPRLHRFDERFSYANKGEDPTKGKLVLWVKDVETAPPAPGR